nr:uncharacterized protein LOC127333840 [Lolium perenne]
MQLIDRAVFLLNEMGSASIDVPLLKIQRQDDHSPPPVDDPAASYQPTIQPPTWLEASAEGTNQSASWEPGRGVPSSPGGGCQAPLESAPLASLPTSTICVMLCSNTAGACHKSSPVTLGYARTGGYSSNYQHGNSWRAGLSTSAHGVSSRRQGWLHATSPRVAVVACKILHLSVRCWSAGRVQLPQVHRQEGVNQHAMVVSRCQ